MKRAALLPVIACVLAVSCLAVSSPVPAKDDQDQARAALARGEIRPLDQVLAAVRAVVPGDVVALDLKRKKDRWRYDVKVLTPAGRRREVKVDAATLAILSEDGDDDDD